MRIAMGLVLLILACLLGLAVFVVTLGKDYILTAESEALPAVEQALADETLWGLAYLDVGAVVTLDRLLHGERDPAALPDPLVDAASLAAQFAAKGVILTDAVDHVVAGAYTAEGEMGTAIVAFGRFDPDLLRGVLKDLYEVEQEAPRLILRHRSVKTCALSDAFAVEATPERVIFGHPWAVATLLSRLEQGDQAAWDLAAWRAYRGEKLFAAINLAPLSEILADVEPHPLAARTLDASAEELPAIERLWAGIDLETLPPSLALETHLDSNDGNWVARTEQAYREGREKLNSGLGKDLPSLTRLASAFAVTGDGNRLSGRLNIDGAVVADLKELPGEAIRLLFSGFGAPSGTAPSAEAPEEQIMEPGDLVLYRPSLAVADLEAFDQAEHSFFQADSVTGPLGVRIQAVRLQAVDQAVAGDGQEGPVVVEYVLEAEGGHIPNLPEDGHHKVEGRGVGTFSVSQVLDRSGRNLLRDEPCGADRNGEAAVLDSEKGATFTGSDMKTVTMAKGRKSVRLEPGTSLRDVAAFEGVLGLRVAGGVEIVQLSAPFERQVHEAHGLRVQFKAAKPGELPYNLSGETDRLLSVRALNGQGRYLASGGISSSGGFGSPGRSVSRDFQGRIATVELVVATSVAAQDFPFRLEAALPAFKPQGVGELQLVAADSAAAFAERHGAGPLAGACPESRRTVELPPYKICSQGLQDYYGVWRRVVFDLKVPLDPMIKGNHSAIEVALDRLDRGDSGPQPFAARAFKTFSWPSDEHSFQQSFYLDGEVPEDFDLTTVTAVEGRVILRIPTKIEQFALDAGELGATGQGGELTARLIGYREGSATLDLEGARDHLLQVLAEDAAGQPVASHVQSIEPDGESGRWKLDLVLGARPERILILVAGAQDVVETPFRIAVETE